jgi:DNA-binding MarR family transcriptional regulator
MKIDGPAWQPEASVSYWVNRLSRALLLDFNERLQPLGFAMSHMPVIGALVGGGARSPTELALAARVEPPSMAETLARMERDGIIERTTNPDDRRSSLVTLTRRSRSRLDKARAALIDGEREAVGDLDATERRQLRTLLERVVRTVEQRRSM